MSTPYREIRESALKTLDKVFGFGRSLVEFPVGGDDQLPHVRLRSNSLGSFTQDCSHRIKMRSLFIVWN